MRAMLLPKVSVEEAFGHQRHVPRIKFAKKNKRPKLRIGMELTAAHLSGQLSWMEEHGRLWQPLHKTGAPCLLMRCHLSNFPAQVVRFLPHQGIIHGNKTVLHIGCLTMAQHKHVFLPILRYAFGDVQIQAGLRGKEVCRRLKWRGWKPLRDLVDGRGVTFDVVAAGQLLVKEGRCEGMRGCMGETNGPPVDHGSGEGLIATSMAEAWRFLMWAMSRKTNNWRPIAILKLLAKSFHLYYICGYAANWTINSLWTN